MYSKKLSGISTLSCSEGSMGLRPEWPWRARRYKIAPDESVQYWYLFLIPPPAQEDLLQKYQERVERLSQQNRVIKMCTDAGFLTTVDVGQYFMTKDTEEFSHNSQIQWHVVRTPCQETKIHLDPKGWIQGNTKIGHVLEVTTSYMQGTHGVEIRIESVNKDSSHSWVRISHGLNKLAQTWSTESTTTTSRSPVQRRRKYLRLQADPMLKQNQEDLPLLVHLQGFFIFLKEHGLILNQELRSIKLTQCQNDWLLFFVMVIFQEKKIERVNSGD